MSDQSPGNSNSSPPESESPALPTLRETMEQAYDAPEPTEGGQSDRNRDSLGRFAPKDEGARPGEAEPKAPSPEKPIPEAQTKVPEPAAEGVQVPQHWSAEFKADFEKLSPEGKAILLKRHHEMEADYTRKSQANAGAVSFAQSLTPVFSDPAIAASLQQSGLNVVQAIQQWAGFHRRALDPDVRGRINLLVDLSQQMGLDPARLFVTQSPQPIPGLKPEDANDPAIKYFADHLGRTTSELQELKNTLQQMRQADVAQKEQASLDRTRMTIDQYADEKGPDGKPLRPYFDAVLEDVIELFKANPERDLDQTYQKAVRMNDQVFAHMQEQQRLQQQNQHSVDRAKQAARGNTRGLTSPVAKPSAKTGNGSLRDVLERSADEIGY